MVYALHFAQLSQYKTWYEKEMDRRQEMQGRLAEVTSAKSTLEQRFHTLSSNHEELIKIMEEYKFENKRLREESAELGAMNDAKFSAVLREKDGQLTVLREAVKKGKERVRVMEGRCLVLEEEVKEMQKNGQQKERVHREEIKRKQKQQRGV